MIIEKKLDSLAKAIHEDFVQKRVEAGDSPKKDSALKPWDELGEGFVESNRQQADHIMTKLRAINCCSESAPPKNKTPYSFSESEIELLARMEHARWIAERKLTGWKFRRGEKDEKSETSPYMINWDQLEEEVKEYDRNAVRDIPRYLEQINEKIYR